ncbi:MAG TPA: hypothetical protein ENN90_13265 [Mariniphaga anaerophila]|uniref:Uncharacterized protein n=1 Tax=Mariniphaga anaerophila TaxID=1484053 RepID=A0A831PK71_9BACT|nr:hypothetical protein [Mariniphaga anaerophila]
MDKNKLLELWHAFTDIPIDNEECIDVDFYIRKKGTDRFAIWHWFDKSFPNGIHEMLYNRIPKTDYP